MKTFNWNARTVVTVAIAFLLTASVGVMGVWLLLSGQPGTGMMESGDHAGAMGGMDMSGDHATMMGAPANRGIFGGYTGAVGLVMILAFVVMVGSLVYALFREKPGQPQPVTCWNCKRPVETDWTACPYCGAALAAQAPHSLLVKSKHGDRRKKS
ncbi:MAG TPA: zinc ribbon domain-containing protein [Anaerolineales bacterium]|nr:zinc ribbon domain-containing protein [Anaerolineales bacterium]